MKQGKLQQLFNDYVWNTEKRTVNLENPNTPLDGYSIAEVFGGSPTLSGAIVSPESSMKISAVWRCVSILSGIISYLPCQPFKDTDNGREIAKDHPTYRLFKRRPNPLYTKSKYFEVAVMHMLLRGNHYAEIILDAFGNIKRFDLLNPRQIESINLLDGQLWYFITDRKDPVPMERMIHVPHLGEDPICGKSTISYAKEDLGIEVSRRDWGSKFWNDGGRASGFLKPANNITPDQKSQAKVSFRDAKKEGGDIVMPFGFEYTKVSIDPAEAEYLAGGTFSIATICRWFGVPLDKVAELGRATFSNIEHQAIAFLQDTIAPIVEKIENEYTTKCYTLDSEADMYMEFNMGAYQRADSQAQADFFSKGIQNGFVTPNEARLKFNSPKTPGGERAFIQQNMMPLDSVDKVLLKQKTSPAPLIKSIRELALLAEQEFNSNGNGNGTH